MKSLAMNKLFSKSREDLPKINSILDEIQSSLKIINSNVLYLTYRIDKISAVQKTIDAKDFYDQDGSSDNNPTDSEDNT